MSRPRGECLYGRAAMPAAVPSLLALDLVTDLSAFVRDTLWVIAAIIGLTAVMVYGLAYMARRFAASKAVLESGGESRLLDARTLDYIHRWTEVVAIASWLVTVMAVAAVQSPDVKALLVVFIQRFPATIFVIITLLVATLLVRVLRRFGAYLRGELRTKPRGLAPPRLWGVTELFLKYFLVAMALLVAFVGAVDLLPPTVPEKAFLESVRNGLTTPSSTIFLGFAIAVGGVVAAFGLGRFSDSLFEDLKQRSRKHGPKVLDQFKAVTRWAVYGLAFVAVLFLELNLVLTPEKLLVVAVVFALLVGVALAVSYDAVRDAFAGLALTQADPFSVGDRVKIGDDLVGDITAISLTMTSLRTGRGEAVTLPNRHVLASPVLNFTRSEYHPILVEVAVAWDVPHRTVEQLLLEAAAATPGVLETPPPRVFGKDVAGNAIVHQLVAYTKDPEQMKQVKSALLYTVQDLFHERRLKALASAA